MRSHKEPPPTGCLKSMPAGPCTMRDSKQSSPVWSLQATRGFAGFDHNLTPHHWFPRQHELSFVCISKAQPCCWWYSGRSCSPWGVTNAETHPSWEVHVSKEVSLTKRGLGWQWLDAKITINLWANLFTFSYFSCLTEVQRHGCMRCSAALCGRGGSSRVVTCPSGCLLWKRFHSPQTWNPQITSHTHSSIKSESLQKQGWWDRLASSRFGGLTGQRHQQVSLSCGICWGISQPNPQPPRRRNHHKHPPEKATGLKGFTWKRECQAAKSYPRKVVNRDNSRLRVQCFHRKTEDYFLLR